MTFAQMIDFMRYEFTSYKILENTGLQWMIALSIFVAVFYGLKLIKFVFVKRLKKIALLTTNDIDDMVVEFIEDIKTPLYFYVAVYAATRYLILTALADKIMWYMLIVFAVYYFVLALNKVIDYFTKKQVSKREDDDDSLIYVLSGILKVFTWCIAVLLILSNLGVNIASLIAGLGIGGIAIAFALQKVLEDIFSSFTIYFDKPFQAGDYIQVDQEFGTVKKIGLKTTRLMDAKGEELIVPNSILTNTKIHNFKRMERRRHVFSLGVDYNTPSTKLRKITKIVSSEIKKRKGVELERVHFKLISDSAFVFEAAYFVNNNEYVKFMDVQEEILFSIKDKFDSEKIKFAYPSRSIYLKKE